MCDGTFCIIDDGLLAVLVIDPALADASSLLPSGLGLVVRVRVIRVREKPQFLLI